MNDKNQTADDMTEGYVKRGKTGRVFKPETGKLYIFEEYSVTVLQGWPAVRAWKIICHSDRCGIDILLFDRRIRFLIYFFSHESDPDCFSTAINNSLLSVI